MKTLIIYNDFEKNQFSIVDGDHSRFHNVLVNSGVDERLQDEFLSWFFTEDGSAPSFSLSEDKSLIECKEWDKVAVCGWIP